MSDRVTIERVEPLSHNWARLDRYIICYRRRDGRVDRLVREVHDHGHGAAVLPYDATRRTVLLVRQFRLPAYLSGTDGHIIEACAGLLDGNDPTECARREAEEELGFRVHNLRQTVSVFSTPGAVTERLTLFLADYGAGDQIGEGGGHPHEGEDIEVLELPLEDVRRLVCDGGIIDAKTVMLILFLERELGLLPL
jgi:nudix-type nucleoside diphosphatase (YffH/AdpP family)